MASLHFQTASAHRGLPLSMVASAGLPRRLPKVLDLLLGRFDRIDVSEAIEVPAPIWPALPVQAPTPPHASEPVDDPADADPASNEDLGDSFGWHDSSLALQEGLDVAECLPTDLPADLPLAEWLQSALV